jgi:hypothetical protein
MVEVVAVNRAMLFALTNRGEVCQITNLIDAFGDETSDPFDAVAAVAALDVDHWFCIDLTQFENVSIH